MTADLRREEIARIAAALQGMDQYAWRSRADLADLAEHFYDAGLRSQDTATARIAASESLTIERDDLDRALQYEFPEPTTENVWGHLEAFAKDREAQIARLPLDGWSLDFEAIERWLVLSDPDGAARIVAKDVDLEYGGDIAERWRRAVLIRAVLSGETRTGGEPPDCLSCWDQSHDADLHDHHTHGDRFDPRIGPAHAPPTTPAATEETPE